MTKHFPGGGPQLDGEDPHFPYGREQVYPGGNFDYHLIPFEAALEAGTAQVMPYYGMPVGTEHEEVGFGFNRGVITGLLRERYGFDGVVCSDWGLLTDTMIDGVTLARPRLGRRAPEHARSAPHKVIEAGVDQFGGEACPEVVVDLVRSGRVDEARIDALRAAAAARQVPPRALRRPLRRRGRGRARSSASPSSVERGHEAQTRSIVLLKNDRATSSRCEARPASTSEGSTSTELPAGTVAVDRPEDAEVALVRIQAPFEPRDGNFLETLFHAGDLDFDADELAWLLELMRQVPTVVDIYLDRAAVIPEIAGGRRRAPRRLRRDGRGVARHRLRPCGARAGSSRSSFPSSMEASAASSPTCRTTRPTRSSRSATGSPTRLIAAR